MPELPPVSKANDSVTDIPQILAASSRSRTLGLSSQRAQTSCATSPGYESSTAERRAETTERARPSGAMGPAKTFTTRIPAGRIRARSAWESDNAAAMDAEEVGCDGKLHNAYTDSRLTQAAVPEAARACSKGEKD